MMRDLREIFITFAKIGAVAYGGGPSMVPILKAEVVERRGWIETESFIDALALGNTLPGPIITKMAAAVGWVRAGLLGACAAVLGVVLPSAAVLLILMGFVNVVKGNPTAAATLSGIRPVVVSMLAFAAWDMAPSALKSRQTAAIFAVSLLLMLWGAVNPAFLIVAGAAVGAIMRL